MRAGEDQLIDESRAYRGERERERERDRESERERERKREPKD